MVNSDHNDNNVQPNKVKNAFSFITSKVKSILSGKKANNNADSENGQKTTQNLRTSENRIDSAVRKFNALNEQRLVAETNFFAELDNDYKLLQEYRAYKIPPLNDIDFNPVSEDTVLGLYRGKQIKIRFTINNDGNKSIVINFEDSSSVHYVLFLQDKKMKINGEEFEMPSQTVVETKYVQDRMFSQLIQTPDMQRTFINLPDGIDMAEQVLSEYTVPPAVPPAISPVVMPTPEYLQNLLGNAKSAQVLLYFAQNTSSSPARTPENEIQYLKTSIEQGKLPKETIITGIKADGGKILTIPAQNCKYEICGSEMRVLDNNGEIKMIARYDSSSASHGLWTVIYDKGKAISGARYISGNLNKPLLTVKYTYNPNDTVTAETNDSYENKNSVEQVPSGLFININKGFKFVTEDQPHLGAVFENQTAFIYPD